MERVKGYFDKMFDNIGDAIEKMGKIIFYVLLITSVMSPIIILVLDVWWNYIDIFLGWLAIPFAFIYGLPIIGLGRLINNTKNNK